MNMIKAKFSKIITLVEEGENNKGSLYIGNLMAANDSKTLSRYDINSIVGLCPDEPKAIEDHDTVSAHYYYPLYDHPSQNINFEVFKRLALVVQRDMDAGYNVLVHCHAGRSRSATFVLFYQMTLEKYKDVPFQDLLAHLFEIHPLTAPNTGFIKQLIKWDNEHRNKESSVDLVKVPQVELDDSSDLITSQVQVLGGLEGMYPVRQENLEEFYRLKPSYMQDRDESTMEYVASDEYDNWMQKQKNNVIVTKDGSHGAHAISYTGSNEGIETGKQLIEYISDRTNSHPEHHKNINKVYPKINKEVESVYQDYDPRE